MRKFLKVVGVIVVLLLVGVFVVLTNPGIVINPRVISYGLEHFGEKITGGTDIHWRGLRTEIESPSFFVKRVRIRFDEFCSHEPALKACVEGVELGFGYRVHVIVPELTELGPITVTDGAIEGIKEKAKQKAKKLKIPSWAEKARIEPISIDIGRLSFEEIKGQLHLKTRIEGAKAVFTSEVKAHRAGASPFTVTTTAEATDWTDHILGPWTLKTDSKLDLAAQGKARVTAQLAPARGKDEYSYSARVNFDGPQLLTTLDTSGRADASGVRGTLDQDVRLRLAAPNPLPQLSQFQLRDCRYDYLIKHDQGQADVRCPVFLGHRADENPLVIATATVSGAYPPASSARYRGHAALEPGHFLSPDVVTSGNATLDFDIVPEKLPEARKLEARVGFAARIPEFAALVKRLAGTPFAIPAPLQSLRGPASVAARGTVTPDGGAITTRFSSRLDSPRRTQRLNLGATNKLKLGAIRKGEPVGVKDHLDLELSDVRLSLPKLSAGSVPQLLPDFRITQRQPSRKPAHKPAAKPGLVDLDASAAIHTSPDHPVQLGSSFTEAPVPVTVNVKGGNRQPILGDITLHKFPVKVVGKKDEIGTVDLRVDSRNRGGLITGFVEMEGRKPAQEPVRIPLTQATGGAAGEPAEKEARAATKFPVPVTEVLTFLLAGKPISSVSESPALQSVPLPPRETRDEGALFQLRRRY